MLTSVACAATPLRAGSGAAPHGAAAAAPYYPQPRGLGAALLEAQLSLLGTLVEAVSAPNQAAVLDALLSIADGGAQVGGLRGGKAGWAGGWVHLLHLTEGACGVLLCALLLAFPSAEWSRCTLAGRNSCCRVGQWQRLPCVASY